VVFWQVLLYQQSEDRSPGVFIDLFAMSAPGRKGIAIGAPRPPDINDPSPAPKL